MLMDEASLRPPIGDVLAVVGAVVTAHLNEGALTGPLPVTVGELVSVPAGDGRAVGIVHNLRKGRRVDDVAVAEIHLLGEIKPADGAAVFRRGLTAHPALDAPIARVTPGESSVVYAQPSVASVRVGSLRRDPQVPAFVLPDALLGKHFAILGSTGSGKSCAVTVVLRAILAQYPKAHIVLIDPHGEYRDAFGERALVLDAASLELPYWLTTFEEAASLLVSGDASRAYAEAAILADAILRAKTLYLGLEPDSANITVDTPVPYRLSDLCRVIEEAMGTLNKPEAAPAYRHLVNRINTIRQDRRYAFMFQSLVVRDSMQSILGRLVRLPVDGKPISVLDISGVPSEVVNVVVSLLCRLFFELGFWADRSVGGVPLLVVCEEAHRYVPGDPALGFAPTRRAIDRIAKEGRKYGVSLCLVSQRPSELSPGSLSQCGTIFALRLSNERDQAYIKNALPDGSDWLIRTLPALGTGEAVVVGEGVTVPMQIRFDPLPREYQPASSTPSFTAAWSEEVDGARVLDGAIARWRGLQR